MTQVRKKQIQPEMPKGFSLFLSDGERSPMLLFLCDFPSFKKFFFNLLFLATLGLPRCVQAFLELWGARATCLQSTGSRSLGLSSCALQA